MKTSITIVAGVVLLLISGIVSYEIIKWRDNTSCTSEETTALKKELADIRAVNATKQQELDDLTKNLNAYTSFKPLADNLILAQAREKPSF
jgi:uncharacterized protein YlxW (UPF0749 family)